MHTQVESWEIAMARNIADSPNWFSKGQMILDSFFRATSDTFWVLVKGRSRPFIFCECTRCGSPPKRRNAESIRREVKSCGCLARDTTSKLQYKPIEKGTQLSEHLIAASDTRRVEKEWKSGKRSRRRVY